MKLLQHPCGDLEFQEIEPWLAHLIAAALQTKNPADDAIAKNLLVMPSTTEEQFCAEWQEYVHPELRALWSSCYEVVMKDLQQLQATSQKLQQDSEVKKSVCLLIIAAHRMAWLRMLNIARCALAAEHCLSEQQLNNEELPHQESEKSDALVQMHLLTVLQQCLIEAEENEHKS